MFMVGLLDIRETFKKVKSMEKPDNPCTVCMKHSGVEKTLDFQGKWITSLSKKVNAILMLLLADLALLVIFLLIHGLPKGG